MIDIKLAPQSIEELVTTITTHAGDAYGRERGHRRIDAGIARLAIHSAKTALLFFLVETWQKQFPAKQLKSH